MEFAVKLTWLENALHTHFLPQSILTRKVGQTDLVLVCDEGSLVGLRMQDYKSLCAAVNPVNIWTQTDSILTSLYK